MFIDSLCMILPLKTFIFSWGMHVYEFGCDQTDLRVSNFGTRVFVILKGVVIICQIITMCLMHAYEREHSLPPQNIPL